MDISSTSRVYIYIVIINTNLKRKQMYYSINVPIYLRKFKEKR